MRHIISTALVALIVGALAGAAFGTVAQSPGQSTTDEPAAVEPAGLNADTVDGRHAVKATYDKNRRKNKIVATNKHGLLPSNIVKTKWSLIRGIPGVLADGRIGWGEVFNKPGILADNQIRWGEIGNKPSGFADGVDNGGYATNTVPCGGTVPAGGRYVTFENMPRHMVHDFQVVPTGSATAWLFVDRVETWNNANGTLRLWVLIKQIAAIPGATCNVRHIAWYDGISVAAAEKRLAEVEVGTRTKHRS